MRFYLFLILIFYNIIFPGPESLHRDVQRRRHSDAATKRVVHEEWEALQCQRIFGQPAPHPSGTFQVTGADSSRLLKVLSLHFKEVYRVPNVFISHLKHANSNEY
jgi:hypothetical protein